MNKIVIDKENVQAENINKNILIETIPRKDIFGITKVIITVMKKSDLYIYYNFDNTKLDITINVNDNVKFNLYEYKYGVKGKLKCTINLGSKCVTNIERISKINQIKEMFVCNLNGTNANINYNFKTISTNKEVYDLIINHNEKNTISNIKNNAVSIENGKVTFQVSSYVDNGIKGCIVNQTNRIINLNNNKCEIRPNLYINEYEVDANHSALIGGFSSNELFYLQSRGIDEISANKLLIKGFLTSDLTNKKLISNIKKIIKEYWR